RLKRVFGIVFVAEHAPADAEDDWSMPPHEQLEGGFLAEQEKPLEQLPVRQFARRRQAPAQPPEHDAQLFFALGHRLTPRHVFFIVPGNTAAAYTISRRDWALGIRH